MKTAFPIFVQGRETPDWWSELVCLIEGLENTRENRVFVRMALAPIEHWLLTQALHDQRQQLKAIDDALSPTFAHETREPISPRECALRLDLLTDEPEEDQRFMLTEVLEDIELN